MNPTQFLEYATKAGVEVWKEGERLRYRSPKALPSKALELLKQLKPELLLLVEDRSDPFLADGLVLSALKGELTPESLLPLLEDPATDDNLRMWIQRTLDGWRYDESGAPVPPPPKPPNPVLEEIGEALRFNGGECASRLMVAVCRLSNSIGEIEEVLRHGEQLGLWSRTERTDALGFMIWALPSRPYTDYEVFESGD